MHPDLQCAGHARPKQSAAQDFLGLFSISRQARAAGAEFAGLLEIVSSAEEPAKRLTAALDARDMLLDAAGGLENLNSEQEKFYNGLAALIRDLEVFAGKLQKPWEELKKTGTDLWSSMTQSARDYMVERIRIDSNARQTVSQLQLEAQTSATCRSGPARTCGHCSAVGLKSALKIPRLTSSRSALPQQTPSCSNWVAISTRWSRSRLVTSRS